MNANVVKFYRFYILADPGPTLLGGEVVAPGQADDHRDAEVDLTGKP